MVTNRGQVNFELRMAIKITLARLSIDYEIVVMSEWRKVAAGKGNASKDETRVALEAALGKEFPKKLPGGVGGRLLNFRDDASDAAGIALWGAKQRHSSLVCASPVPISAPLVGQKQGGSRKRPR